MFLSRVLACMHTCMNSHYMHAHTHRILFSRVNFVCWLTVSTSTGLPSYAKPVSPSDRPSMFRYNHSSFINWHWKLICSKRYNDFLHNHFRYSLRLETSSRPRTDIEFLLTLFISIFFPRLTPPALFSLSLRVTIRFTSVYSSMRDPSHIRHFSSVKACWPIPFVWPG